MTKSEISQYYYLNREIVNAQKLLKELQNKKGEVLNTDKSFIDEQEKKQELKIKYCRKLREEIEKYIGSVDDSLTRQVLYERYIRCKTWAAVACAVGGGNTPDSVRKISERYLARCAKSA